MSKTIVITGAGSGLGKHLAQRFAADGEQVVLLGRTLSKLETVANHLGDRAFSVACDVGRAESVKDAFSRIAERYRTIDVLINNAMRVEMGLLINRTEDEIQSVLNTNLLGALLCSRAAIPLMERDGHIINVSSESVETPFPHHVVYQATKSGVERMSYFLQKELEPTGIRVTVVRAGEMIEKGKHVDTSNYGFPEEIERFFEACKEKGLDLTKRPKADYASCTGIFRAVIDQPPDIQITAVHYLARHSD